MHTFVEVSVLLWALPASAGPTVHCIGAYTIKLNKLKDPGHRNPQLAEFLLSELCIYGNLLLLFCNRFVPLSLLSCQKSQNLILH